MLFFIKRLVEVVKSVSAEGCGLVAGTIFFMFREITFTQNRTTKHMMTAQQPESTILSGVDMNEVLIHAARLGDTAVIAELLDRKIDGDARDSKGYTPLIIACYNNHYDAAKLLLDAGADVNAQDTGGNTALMGVAFKGYLDVGQLLIERGADLNLQHGNGGTALMFAAMFGRNDLLRLLLEKGADHTLTDTRGLSASDLAAQQGNEEGIRILEKV